MASLSVVIADIKLRGRTQDAHPALAMRSWGAWAFGCSTHTPSGMVVFLARRTTPVEAADRVQLDTALVLAECPNPERSYFGGDQGAHQWVWWENADGTATPHLDRVDALADAAATQGSQNAPTEPA